MRMAFGLVSLLVCALIIAFVASSYTSQVASSGASARVQAEQIAGIDAGTGGRVTENVKFDTFPASGSKMQYLVVKSIAPGSSYQSYYGIQAGDYIDEIGPQRARDNDADTSMALAHEAYQRQWPVGIWRNGKHFMLPEQKAQAAAATPGGVAGVPGAAGVTPAAQQPAAFAPAQQQQPAQPAMQPQPQQGTPAADPPPTDTRTGLQKQLDAIQSYGQ